jgi:cytochrome c2
MSRSVTGTLVSSLESATFAATRSPGAKMPVLAAMVCYAIACAACSAQSADASATSSTIGDPQRGAQLIQQFGCGSCHTIPGIRGANGVVGPPLYFFSRRTFIAGQVPNTPANLAHWIQAPGAIEPGTAMPSLGVTEPQARDMVAYLYTLR